MFTVFSDGLFYAASVTAAFLFSFSQLARTQRASAPAKPPPSGFESRQRIDNDDWRRPSRCHPDGIFALAWRILEILWINLLLSGDNAILIALACRGLVAEQRRWGVFLGVLGGLALRVVLTLGIAQVMSKLLDDEANHSHIAPKNDLRSAIVAIIAADIVMSLDNVIAIAAAAHGSMLLIIFGLVLSAPIVIFGAGFLLRLLERFPPLVWAGAGLLGWVAGEMIADDPSSELFGLLDHEKLQIGLPVLGCALVLIVSFGAETARIRREGG